MPRLRWTPEAVSSFLQSYCVLCSSSVKGVPHIFIVAPFFVRRPQIGFIVSWIQGQMVKREGLLIGILLSIGGFFHVGWQVFCFVYSFRVTTSCTFLMPKFHEAPSNGAGPQALY